METKLKNKLLKIETKINKLIVGKITAKKHQQLLKLFALEADTNNQLLLFKKGLKYE